MYLHSTGEETSFGNTQKHTCYHEAGEVLYDTSESHDDAPANNQDAKVSGRSLELLQDDVGRNLKENVWDEKYGDPVKLSATRR